MKRFVSDKDFYAIKKTLLDITKAKRGSMDEECIRKVCLVFLEMLCEKDLTCKLRTDRIEAAEEAMVPMFYKILPYDWYLKTDHWSHVRGKAMSRFHSRCAVCNSEDQLQVHHRTYANLGKEEPEDLTVLCDSCHELFHSNGKIKR